MAFANLDLASSTNSIPTGGLADMYVISGPVTRCLPDMLTNRAPIRIQGSYCVKFLACQAIHGLS